MSLGIFVPGILIPGIRDFYPRDFLEIPGIRDFLPSGYPGDFFIPGSGFFGRMRYPAGSRQKANSDFCRLSKKIEQNKIVKINL